MWYTSSSGWINLQITKEEAQQGSHQGQCDDDVRGLSQKPRIAKQLKVVDAKQLRDELQGYGAWDEVELSDHEQNLQRLLWLACGQILDDLYEKQRA
jgi:hypothetical protein